MTASVQLKLSGTRGKTASLWGTNFPEEVTIIARNDRVFRNPRLARGGINNAVKCGQKIFAGRQAWETTEKRLKSLSQKKYEDSESL